MKNIHHKSNKEKKILWLQNNPDAWNNYEHMNMEDKKALFKKMQSVGLYSKTTY